MLPPVIRPLSVGIRRSLVGAAGFEPALTRFQAEDVDQATLRPVVGRVFTPPRVPHRSRIQCIQHVTYWERYCIRTPFNNIFSPERALRILLSDGPSRIRTDNPLRAKQVL